MYFRIEGIFISRLSSLPRATVFTPSVIPEASRAGQPQSALGTGLADSEFSKLIIGRLQASQLPRAS